MEIKKQNIFRGPVSVCFCGEEILDSLHRRARIRLTHPTCASLVTSLCAAATHGGMRTANPRRWAQAGMVFLPNNLSQALGHGFSGGVLLVFLVFWI
jgi:hypothetical protein